MIISIRSFLFQRILLPIPINLSGNFQNLRKPYRTAAPKTVPARTPRISESGRSHKKRSSLPQTPPARRSPSPPSSSSWPSARRVCRFPSGLAVPPALLPSRRILPLSGSPQLPLPSPGPRMLHPVVCAIAVGRSFPASRPFPFSVAPDTLPPAPTQPAPLPSFLPFILPSGELPVNLHKKER